MMKVLKCRRSFVALIAIGCLTTLGLVNKLDVATAICGIVASIAAANASESFKKKEEPNA